MRLSLFFVDPEVKLIIGLFGLAIALAVIGIAIVFALIGRDRKKS